MDGSRGRNGNVRNGLRSCAVYLIGREATILKRLAQIARKGGAGAGHRVSAVSFGPDVL